MGSNQLNEDLQSTALTISATCAIFGRNVRNRTLIVQFWRPTSTQHTSLLFGAPTRNRTRFVCLQGSCIASNALEAITIWWKMSGSNTHSLSADGLANRCNTFIRIFQILEEGVGFEPTAPYRYGTTVFKTAAIIHLCQPSILG